jgi:predicted nucleotidyltransferase
MIGMNRAHRISLARDQLRLVREILSAHLPLGASVWVFGSRAGGQPRRFSDLDLAIDAQRPLSFSETGSLREAFDDSDLPYKVDIVDWHVADEGFRRLIAPARVPLTLPA